MTEAVGNKLFEWFRAGKKIDGKYTPWMSFSTGFRVAEYNRDEKDSGGDGVRAQVVPDERLRHPGDHEVDGSLRACGAR